MPGPDEDAVRGTGGQVDDMTIAMIDAVYDQDSSCQEMLGNALFDLGKKKPALVLSSCYSYLKKHSKLSTGHRIVILQCMERIIDETLDQLDPALAVDLVKQASHELTHSKEVAPEWQTAASGVLVALGKGFCDEVMDEVLQKFQPGVLPHFFVVKTLGSLAAANVYGMVPHLTAVLGTMLPMMGMAKHDNMRWVFSTALSQFCEAVIEYVANLDKAPDQTVKKEMFSGEIFAAYDILFNIWLQSREIKLQLAVVMSVGNMAHLMTQDKLEEQLPKMLQGILGLYRRHSEPYHITKSLSNILDAACSKDGDLLDIHFDNLLAALFPQVFAQPNYNNPLSIKNSNEVLRCFAILARTYSGRLTGVLLQKMESSNEKIRIGILMVFKHLINAADEAMEDKKEVVVSGLKMLVTENNNKVKKVFAQVVIAMAHHGYLELEGGQQMVEFIVRQCALADDPPGKKPADPEYISNQSLRAMCDNILQLLTTTVPQMEPVLWPYLLELVVPEQYTEACGSVCRNLAHLASKKRENSDEDYDIEYDQQGARWRAPTNGRGRGRMWMLLMKSMSPNINGNLVETMGTVIPKKVHYFEGGNYPAWNKNFKEETWSQKNWEDLLLKMLSKTLDVVDNEEWIAEFGDMLGSHVGMYTNYSEEKNILYKCLGIVMRKSTKKDFVNRQLDLIFSTFRNTDQTEREGCAIAMGFAAASHLDAVLSKLESVGKTCLLQKSSGLFSFRKEKSEADPEKMKATLVLCYGFVALYSPPALLMSRMEATILRTIMPFFSNIKDVTVKTNLIRTVDLIGKSLHPDHLQTQFKFTNRGDFINHMQSYMKGESTANLNNETRAVAMNACATLVKLDPQLSDAEVFDLIKTSMDAIFPLPPDGIGIKKGKEETYDRILEIEILLEATFEAFHDLLQEILRKDLSPNGIDSIFKHLVPWMLSVHEHERERAVTTCSVILEFFIEHIAEVERMYSTLDNECVVLARLVPRCSDPSTEVRQKAIACVELTLRIASRLEGKDPEEKDVMISALPTLKERLKKGDPSILFSVVNDLSKVISKKLPAAQLELFIEALQESLLDAQSHSSSGACVVLNGIIKHRGGELYKLVEKLLHSLHDKLAQMQCPQTKTGTLRTIRTLASHHLTPVMTTLLNYPIPFDDVTVEIWKILSSDPVLTKSMLDHMLGQLRQSLPYEEKFENERLVSRTATLPSMAVTCGLKEIFSTEESADTLTANYAQLFASLLVRVGTTVGNKPPKQHNPEKDAKGKDKKKQPVVKEMKALTPSGYAVEAFREFLIRTKSTDIMGILDLEDCWVKFENEALFTEGITILTRAIATGETTTEYVPNIAAPLVSVLSSVYDPQRIVVAAFFAELINQRCVEDLPLMEIVVNSLLGRLVDSSHVVRMLCIRGLGNISSMGRDQVQRYSTTVLSAMMAGMDDKEDPDDFITLEAMSGLSRILSEIDEKDIREILINISLKIRPCFQKLKPSVRAQAFILFGNLSRFGGGPSKFTFLEQIHTNFVCLLLHLNDPDNDVRKACKYALRMLGPLMESEETNEKFQKHLLEEANLFYGEFLNDISKLIIQDFTDKVNFYVMNCVSFFKSFWPEIKSNAALFTGYLLGNLTKEKQAQVSKEHVCQALILLLKDQSPVVRSRAAEAMSLLDNY
ncbi:hypothetical protein ScPMuIL_002002 [Solemya velum]